MNRMNEMNKENNEKVLRKFGEKLNNINEDNLINFLLGETNDKEKAYEDIKTICATETIIKELLPTDEVPELPENFWKL